MTVVALKAEAKARGLIRCSKLRKAELIWLLNANIMNAPVPDLKVQTLAPSRYVPTSRVREIYDNTKSAINKFADLIISLVPPEPKRIVNEGLDALK